MITPHLPYLIWFIINSIFFNGKLYSQGFEKRNISEKVSNTDLGNQVVVRSYKGLVAEVMLKGLETK